MKKLPAKNLYTIKIENFEGPFDLLYHLIEKNKMSIYDIKIEQVADQYMEYLYNMKNLDLEIASEFIVMAATLLHIKSRLLLPQEKSDEIEKPEEIDPKEELLFRIIQYKKYKEFSLKLKENEEYWEKAFYKMPEEIKFEFEDDDLDISSVKLKEIYIKLIKQNKLRRNENTKEDIIKIIQYEKVSLKSKIRIVLRSLMDKVCIRLSEIFLGKGSTKLDIITGFMAILELAKINKIELFQKELFSEIEIRRKDLSDENIDMIPEENNIV